MKPGTIVATILLGIALIPGCKNSTPEGDAESALLFHEVLQLQGITFKISSLRGEFNDTLIIEPSGLEIINRAEKMEIDGQVIAAEIEDLNSDGSPEVLVFTQSDGSGSYGTVIAYSVNNRKSMSQIYFPPVADNDRINQGYMGHDEFALIEASLAHRFPIYKEGDSNAEPTGGIRQISYKLVDGEASRRFEVKDIQEFK